jgi:probable HAF family extracellular repeat protein
MERAWKFQSGTMTDIGTLGGPQAAATAINTSGQIVGSAQTSSDANDGFIYTGGKMSDLGPNIYPYAINDAGVIVGQGPGGAVIDNGATVQNLNTLVPAGSGFTLTTAIGINRSGQIVAEGSNRPKPRVPAHPELTPAGRERGRTVSRCAASAGSPRLRCR